ncbi:hypothetical protein V5E97_13505 [Singulisphaera sp. Ch08]|uniref:Uncharacterized protein n=1 Tax=Singulisphaera sp. Ch08 TaxID=3120278 RepID=A0AAU7CP36_9BACT
MAFTVETRSWPEVVKFYRDLGPMLNLVEFIASSPYSTSLFPTTSHARLCIARTSPIHWGHAMLTVEFDPVGECFVFQYFEAAPTPQPWVTTCPTADGRMRFERLMKKRLRWFR